MGGWGQLDEDVERRVAIRKVIDLISPPMDSNDRDEALRILNELVDR